MRTVLVIGIGLGAPEHLTLQAVAAMNRADVFFVMEKGSAADDLGRLRRALCERFATTRPFRFVAVPDPPRDRTADHYEGAVAEWTVARARIWEALLGEQLDDGQCGAFLAWGDPAFYDATLRVLEQVVTTSHLQLEVEVTPGISSIQALAAAHRISLTRVGRPVQVTTGRRLAAEGLPDGADDVVVMLDGDASFRHLDPTGLSIYWGAYLGGPDQILIAGDLSAASAPIIQARSDARTRHGWIMDTYLLRRTARRQATK